LKNGFNKGDAIVAVGKDFEDIEIGDIIIFRTAARTEQIIHRVVEKGDNWVSTKGDNNPSQLQFETRIHEDDIVGAAKIRIPLIGWVKVGFLMLLGKL
jgi:signal peptidase I